jgi:NADH dehydrogenase (ubiquinone) 1 alpha/beta subcomplex 1
MSSLATLRNNARTAVFNAAVRMAPRATSSAPLRLAPALWSRSFASGGFLPKEEVSTRVMDVVKNFQNVDPKKVTATSHFINDLGLDSLDTVEV